MRSFPVSADVSTHLMVNFQSRDSRFRQRFAVWMMVVLWRLPTDDHVVDHTHGSVLSELLATTASVLVALRVKELVDISRLLLAGINYN